MEIEKAISDYLKQTDWVSPKEIIDAIYPQFQKQYDKAIFKRLFFRALKRTPKIMKNSHSRLYAYERKEHLTKDDIEFIQTFFELVDHPRRFYVPNLKVLNQYPDIPLEETFAFKQLRLILSKLWENPRDAVVVRFTKEKNK
jgi:hypothetical protein